MITKKDLLKRIENTPFEEKVRRIATHDGYNTSWFVAGRKHTNLYMNSDSDLDIIYNPRDKHVSITVNKNRPNNTRFDNLMLYNSFEKDPQILEFLKPHINNWYLKVIEPLLDHFRKGHENYLAQKSKTK